MARLMVGRNGTDALTKFTSITACVLLLVSMLLGETAGSVLFGLSLALLIYSYFRAFSRNIYKRREENEKYTNFKNSIFQGFRQRKALWGMRKCYCFFKCPSCKSELRVPKGKGQIRITCRKCGEAFIKKT